MFAPEEEKAFVLMRILNSCFPTKKFWRGGGANRCGGVRNICEGNSFPLDHHSSYNRSHFLPLLLPPDLENAEQRGAEASAA